MLFLIHKLQKKPERVKKQVALIASCSITGIIVITWLVNLSLKEVPISVSEEEARPFQALAEGMNVLWSDTKNALEEVAGVFGSMPEAVPDSPASTTEEAMVESVEDGSEE